MINLKETSRNKNKEEKRRNVSMRKVLAMLLVLSMVFGVVACGNKETKKEQEVMKVETEEKSAEIEQDDIQEEVVEEKASEPTETSGDQSAQETKKETKTENKKPASTPSQSTQTSGTPATSTPVTTPTQTETKVEECEHWYQPEFKEYDYIKHYIYGCNGCGYPLFTLEGKDAVNLPDLYSHPACYSEKLGMDCVGGGYHSEVYYQGYCGVCHDEVKWRQCMFSEMGKRCVKNEALGAYEHVELGQNPRAFFKSCSCGSNTIYVGMSGKGQLITKETCSYCGDVKLYPQSQ